MRAAISLAAALAHRARRHLTDRRGPAPPRPRPLGCYPRRCAPAALHGPDPSGPPRRGDRPHKGRPSSTKATVPTGFVADRATPARLPARSVRRATYRAKGRDQPHPEPTTHILERSLG